MTSNTRPYRSHPYSQPPTSRRCAPAVARHAPASHAPSATTPTQAPRAPEPQTPAPWPTSPSMPNRSLLAAPCPHRRRESHGLALREPLRSPPTCRQHTPPERPNRRRPRHGLQAPSMPHRSLLAAPEPTPKTRKSWPRAPRAAAKPSYLPPAHAPPSEEAPNPQLPRSRACGATRSTQAYGAPLPTTPSSRPSKASSNAPPSS